MRFRRRGQPQVWGCPVEVHTIPGQQFTRIVAINYRQRVDPVNAGDNSLGFYVGQAAGRNSKFLIVVFARKPGAGSLDIPHCQTKFFAQRTKILAS